MVANLLWTRFVLMRYTGRALIAWIMKLDQDPDGQKAVEKLFEILVKRLITKDGLVIMGQFMGAAMEWLFSSEVRTGEKVKVKTETDQKGPDGKPIVEIKEIDEILTPIQLVAKVLSSYIFAKFRGMNGGVKTQLGNLLESEASDSGMPLSAASMKALSQGKFGPAIAETVARFTAGKIKSKSTNNEVATTGDGGFVWGGK